MYKRITYCPGYLIRLLIPVLIIHAFNSAFAQTSGQILEHLTSDRGLSSNKVEAILQDHEGYYWIATQNGLNRFDGTRFKIFRHDTDDSTSLTNNYCTALAEDPNGDIWIATQKGVNRYLRNKGYFQSIYLHHPTINSEIANRIYDLCADRDGHVWIAGNGLWKYDLTLHTVILFRPDSTISSSIPRHSFITHLVFDPENNGLWFSTGQELVFYAIDKDQFYHERYNPLQWKVFESADAAELTLDHQNRLWFRDKRTQQLSYFDIDQNQITTTHKKVDYGIKRISADEKGRIWIFYWLATSEIYDPESATSVSDFFVPQHHHSMLSEKGSFLFVDQEKNYWIGSGSGISIYNEANQYYQLHQILVEDRGTEKDPLKIKALAQTTSGYLWIATNLGLFKYHLVTRAYALVKLNIPIPIITTLCSDGELLWIGVYDKLYAMNITTEQIVKTIQLRPGIFFIKRGYHSDLWVGLWSGGLYNINLDTEEIKSFSKQTDESSSLKSNNLISGFVDKDELWIGYNAGKGFSRYEMSTGHFTHFHPHAGDSSTITSGTITVIAKGLENNLWLGTHGNGVYYYRPGTGSYEHFQQHQGLQSNYINSILPDDNGNLWISTADGMNYLNTDKKSIQHLDMDLVFSDNDFAANGLYGMNNRFYFFCNNIFVEIDPASYQPEQKFPQIIISSFKIFDREITHTGEDSVIRLSHKENFFSFEFSSLKTRPLREVDYAYQLEGFDPAWNDVGAQQFASYTNVPAGNYKFKVKATNEEGEWSDVFLSVPVHIRPPFWRTWWFIGLCIVLVTAGVFSLYRFRIHQIKKVFSIRAKISQDLHDDLGASLSSIHIFSAVAEEEMHGNPEKAKEIVHQINQNSRQVMENMSDIVWAMNTESSEGVSLAGRIKNYGYDLLSQKNIECSYKIDSQVEKKMRKPEARKSILLIVKEALNNIAKYSEASLAEVEITVDHTNLHIRISDNGRGFDTTITRNGNGLHNMKHRADLLGGSFEMSSSPGSGTRIQCLIPLANISDR